VGVDDISPRVIESRANNSYLGELKLNVRRSPFSPGPLAGAESLRRHCDERSLLFRSEFNHGPILVWVTQRGENPAGDAEVGMAHVLVLGHALKVEGQATKFIWSHLDKGLVLNHAEANQRARRPA
jgi:hypothetical protein